jgi:hypothetical protein
MQPEQRSKQIAQSASALGAGILGFGIGTKWGGIIARYSLLIIIVGAIIHIAGMYVMQIKNQGEKTNYMAKALWFSAWICLIALIVIIIYLVITKS